jgi:hypothetical protein
MAYDAGENEDDDRIALGGNKPAGSNKTTRAGVIIDCSMLFTVHLSTITGCRITYVS